MALAAGVSAEHALALDVSAGGVLHVLLGGLAVAEDLRLAQPPALGIRQEPAHRRLHPGTGEVALDRGAPARRQRGDDVDAEDAAAGHDLLDRDLHPRARRVSLRGVSESSRADARCRCTRTRSTTVIPGLKSLCLSCMSSSLSAARLLYPFSSASFLYGSRVARATQRSEEALWARRAGGRRSVRARRDCIFFLGEGGGGVSE